MGILNLKPGIRIMTYTVEQLSKLTKPEISVIAKELKITGRSRMTREQLVDNILALAPSEPINEPISELVSEPVTEPILEPTSKPTSEPIPELTSEPTPEPVTEPVTKPVIETTVIPSPTEFFNQIIELNDALAIQEACNGLLNALSKKYSVATISKKLSEYKKWFYSYQHNNPELNELVEIRNGTNNQHIAARLLSLTDEQSENLSISRNERDNARAGFDKNGDIRKVEILPIDIKSIIDKSIECLKSNDAYTIGAGIINLTGLRANEQNMLAREYPDWGIVERKMDVVSEYAIKFKGISKKSNLEDTSAYHTRITLAPAQLIVDAQNRFKVLKSVTTIGSDYEKYRKGFMQTFYNRYQEIFGSELSTIEAYSDDGKLIDSNGTPHKGRAFYACALRSILNSFKSFTDSACNSYIQLCLAHESVAETIKYLGRYDDKNFVNPIDIPIPTNIKKLGKMLIAPGKIKKFATTSKTVITSETVIPPEVKEIPQNTFDVDTFTRKLDGDLQVEFKKLMDGETTLTDTVLALIASLKQKTIAPTITKKTSVSDEITTIAEAIMDYNDNQKLNTNRVVPTYSLINKISEKIFGKTMAKVTVDAWIKSNENTLHKEVEELGIPGGLYNSQWNGKHHRKTMDDVIDSIAELLKK